LDLPNQPETPSQNDATTALGAPIEAPVSETSSWRPADYYAAPPAKARFPRWVPISCGVAAIFALVFMSAIGIFLKNGGLSSFVALAIGEFQGELKGMMDEDVPEAAREQLDQSLRGIRERLTGGTMTQSAVLPLLQEMQKVSGDRKVTAEELRTLQSVVDKILQENKSEPGPSSEPVEL